VHGHIIFVEQEFIPGWTGFAMGTEG
jgi:hypothetical protein